MSVFETRIDLARIPTLDLAERAEWIQDWKDRFYARFSKTRRDVVLDAHGKPHWKDPDAALPHFNLSHSDRWIGVAWASRPLGLDLEELKHPRFQDHERLRKLVERYFHPDEAAQWPVLNDPSSAFIGGWVRKESIAKAIGRGLGVGIRHYKTAFGCVPSFEWANGFSQQGFLYPRDEPELFGCVTIASPEEPRPIELVYPA